MEWISTTELLDAAKQADLQEPSASQLKRLRSEGLIQRPTQKHELGSTGSSVVYPVEAATQLVEVLRLQQDVKKFEHLRFWAFWDGLWVDPHALRTTLLRHLADVTRDINRIISQFADPYDAADAIARKIGLTKAAGPRWLQQRTGRRQAQSALYLAVVIAAGGEPDWDTPDEQDDDPASPSAIMSAASGLDWATGPNATPVGPLITDPPPIGNVYQHLAKLGVTKLRQWVPALRSAPVVELGHARDLARALFEDYPLFQQVTTLTVDHPDEPLRAVELIEYRTPRTGTAIGARCTWLAMALLLRRGLPAEPLNTNAAAIREATAEWRGIVTEEKGQMKPS